MTFIFWLFEYPQVEFIQCSVVGVFIFEGQCNSQRFGVIGKNLFDFFLNTIIFLVMYHTYCTKPIFRYTKVWHTYNFGTVVVITEILVQYTVYGFWYGNRTESTSSYNVHDSSKSCVLAIACKFQEHKILDDEIMLSSNHICNNSVQFGFALAHPKHEPNFFGFDLISLF